MLPFCVFFLGMIEKSDGFSTKVEWNTETKTERERD
jgi:hypothetical protein